MQSTHEIPAAKQADQLAAPEKAQLLPSTEIAVILAAHSSQGDAENVKTYLKPGDLFIPELSGWSNDNRIILRKVAAGELQPLLALSAINPPDQMRGFVYQLLMEIYQSEVDVELIDLPAGHGLNQALDDAQDEVPYQATLAESMPFMKEQLTRFVDLQNQREAYMVNQLLGLLKMRAFQGKNDGAGTAQKVVLTLGAQHHDLVGKLAGQAFRFEQLTTTAIHRVSQSVIDSGSYENQIFAAMQAGSNIPDEWLSRAVIEKMFQETPTLAGLFEVFEDGLAVEAWIRQAIDQFSLDELSRLYSQVVDTYLERVKDHRLIVVSSQPFAALNLVAEEILIGTETQPSLLRGKGIEIPKKNELEDYLDFDG